MNIGARGQPPARPFPFGGGIVQFVIVLGCLLVIVLLSYMAGKNSGGDAQ